MAKYWNIDLKIIGGDAYNFTFEASKFVAMRAVFETLGITNRKQLAWFKVRSI